MHYASMRPRLVATCGPSLSLSSALLLSQNLSACIRMPRSAGSFCSCPLRAARRSYRCSTSTPPSSARTRAGATEELVYYEALGLVPEGEGVKLLVDGSTVVWVIHILRRSHWRHPDSGGFVRVLRLSLPH